MFQSFLCVYLVFVCYLLDLFVQFQFFEYMILSKSTADFARCWQ